MANKSWLAPIVLIELQPRCDRSSEPFRRVPFIALKINVGEIEVKRGREYKAVFIWNLRQKMSGIFNVDFVGVEPAPPISWRCDASMGFENFATQLIGESAVIMANDFDL
jgi:hypothetical protein